MSKNIGHLSGRKGLANNLFEELGRSAAERGTVDPADMERHGFIYKSIGR